METTPDQTFEIDEASIGILPVQWYIKESGNVKMCRVDCERG
jgi:hypothetical protein